MKWIFLFATSLLLGACNITLNTPITKVLEATERIENNEYICSDSLDNILMHPANVKMYQLFSLIRDSSYSRAMDSLFNYPIKKNLGKLKKQEKTILNFIICNKQQYRTNYTPIRQPFSPNFALEFTQGKQTVYYFVSFGTGEIAIADITGNFKFFLMSDANIMMRWFDYVLLERNKNNSKK